MPEIQAFRGIRYNLGRVGSLSDVVTPPYDVIGPELQDHFYKLHPNSFIRIDLNKIEPGDDDEKNNRYTRAAKFYKQWRDEGVLVSRGRSGHLRLSPGVHVRRHEVRPQGLPLPAAALAVRRGPGLPARRNPAGRQGRSADADRRDEGPPEPGLRPVSRSQVRGRQNLLDAGRRPARRRWWPPITWAWSIASGR